MPKLVFFFCGCSPCKEVGSRLSECLERQPHLALVGSTELGPADAGELLAHCRLELALASDPPQLLKKRYAVQHCPALRGTDAKGRVVSRWDHQGGAPGISLSDLAALIQKLGADGG